MSGWIKIIISGVTVIAGAVGVYLYGENAEKKEKQQVKLEPKLPTLTSLIRSN